MNNDAYNEKGVWNQSFIANYRYITTKDRLRGYPLILLVLPECLISFIINIYPSQVSFKTFAYFPKRKAGSQVREPA